MVSSFSAFRLWGLARWGHDNSSTGRPSRRHMSSSSGARLQPQSIVSRSSTRASRFCSRPTSGSFFQLGRSRHADVVPLWTSFSQHQLSQVASPLTLPSATSQVSSPFAVAPSPSPPRSPFASLPPSTALQEILSFVLLWLQDPFLSTRPCSSDGP